MLKTDRAKRRSRFTILRGVQAYELGSLNKFEFVCQNGKQGLLFLTVFYTDGELDIHVGFRPNRAVLFPCTYYHCAHQSDIQNLKRYTASIFITEYNL